MITARAFAKINLDLHVTGSEADGYHELRTTFQSIALHDVLTFVPRRGPFVIESDDPACPTDGNIVARAAAMLWQLADRSGLPAGVHVRIAKRIPVAAGLGGGSADAAAALRALMRLWRIRVPRNQLQETAAALGADVPFFLQGGTVRGTGRGDVLSALVDRPRRWVVVAMPPFGVATKDAYRWFDEGGAATLKGSADKRVAGAIGRSLQGRQSRNDLQAVIVARHPEVGQLIDALTRAGASRAAMSGSGSAVFGLFPRLSAAEGAADALIGRGRRVLVTRTLSRSEHERLARPELARK
jgi:4-diphosphocytidyl-2-C-methyl-D-erythritol kinase